MWKRIQRLVFGVVPSMLGMLGVVAGGGGAGVRDTGGECGKRSDALCFECSLGPQSRRVLAVVLCSVFVSLCVGAAPALAGLTYPFQRELKPASGSFGSLNASSVAVDDRDGDTYVADSASGTVDVFETATGSQLSEAEGGTLTGGSTPAGSFDNGAVSVAANNTTGAVYVLDSTDKVVDELNAKGEYVCQITGGVIPSESECDLAGSVTPTGGFATPTGLTVDQATGEVYVLDPENEAVDVFSATGEYLSARSFSLSSIPGGFAGATNTRSVAVDDFNGQVYVADSGSSPTDLVYEFEDSGKYVTTWTGGKCQEGSLAGASGSAVCSSPAESFAMGYVSVAADNASGRVYVTVAGGVAQEQTDVFDATGVYRGQFSHGFEEPYGTAVGQATGSVYVSNSRSGLVDVFGALAVPSVVSEGVTGLSPLEVTLHGQVDPEGLPMTGCRFEYGTSRSYGQVAECSPSYREIPVDHGAHPVAAHLNLESGTTYHYRLVAANANAENTDEPPRDSEFTAPGARLIAESVAEVSSTSVTFAATIDPDGTPASYFFEYGTSSVAACTLSSCSTFPAPPGEAIGAGSAPVEVPVQHLQGLEAGKTYYYRAVALSEVGGRQVELPGAEHAFTTQGTGAFALPDGRQWQLVTPADKHGARPETDARAEDALQAAADGNALTYITSAPTESDPSGFQNFMQVMSSRDRSGWHSQDLEIPHNEAPGVGGLGVGQEYRLFSNDLSLAGLRPFGAFDSSLSGEASEQTSYLRKDFADGDVEAPCSEDCFVPLVRAGNVPAGVHFSIAGECQIPHGTSLSLASCGPAFLGGNGDLSDVVVNSDVALTQTPVEATPRTEFGPLYEWSDGALKVVSVPPGSSVAVEGYLGSASSPIHGRAARTVSADGSRVVWHTYGAAQAHLYVTNTTGEQPVSVQVDVGPAGEQLSGEPEFQAANTEDTRVWFTDGGSLYEFDVEDDRTELLASEASNVVEGGLETERTVPVFGVSEDGSWAYFVARSVVAAGAIQGEPNLYVRHGGVTRLVATLAPRSSPPHPGDSPDWAHNGETFEGTVRVSPDGEWLAFMSERALTGYDNRDVSTGRPVEEVYLYHAPESLETGARSLICVSCDPSGGRPIGEPGPGDGALSLSLGTSEGMWSGDLASASLPGGTVSGYASRALSDEGRLFFNSDDGLVPRDVNDTWDVYEYEPAGVGSCEAGSDSGSVVFEPARRFVREKLSGEAGAGCVGLISSGTSPEESGFVDASESGGDVFFLTSGRLVGEDLDTSYDIYDAHQCTSASPCLPVSAQAPPSCETADACRAAPAAQPEVFGAPASATFAGPGDVSPPAPAKVTKKQTVKCPRGKTRNKHGKCVRSKRKKAKARKSAHIDRRAKR